MSPARHDTMMVDALMNAIEADFSEENRKQALDFLFTTFPPQSQREFCDRLLQRLEEINDLKQVHEKLRGEIQRLSSPPGFEALLMEMGNGLGSSKAIVSVGGVRSVVNIAPEIDGSTLHVGDSVLLNSTRACIMGHRGLRAVGGELAVVEKLLEGEARMIVNIREQRMVAELAHALRESPPEAGTVVRFDESARLALETVEKPDGMEGFTLEAVPQTTFGMIGGLDRQIEEIRTTIELPLLQPERFQRYGLPTARGITLHGPPGCGKTLFAQAIANELSHLYSRGEEGEKGYFMNIKGPEILSEWVGVTERRIRMLIRSAREKSIKTGRLVVIFWDEIDSIARSRGSFRLSGVEGTIVPTLLSEIQGFESEERGNVIIIAATNRLDLVDPALLRPRRLGDLILEVPRPDRSAAASIFSKYLTRTLLPPGDGADVGALIDRCVSHIYAPSETNKIAVISFRDGARQPLFRRDLVSGATIQKMVAVAAKRACLREVEERRTLGITERDLALAIEEEFAALAKALTPHNIRDYVTTVHADRDIVGVSPVRQSGAARASRWE